MTLVRRALFILLNMTKIIAAITGVQGYVPEDVLTNADLAKIVDTTDEWIISRTGIKERRILRGEGQGTSVMGAEAVRKLLEKTNTKPEEVDLLICATVTPDHFFPSTANLICDKVGISFNASYDINSSMAVGINFHNDQVGLQQTNSFSAQYSYRLLFNERKYLAFGIGVGSGVGLGVGFEVGLP